MCIRLSAHYFLTSCVRTISDLYNFLQSLWVPCIHRTASVELCWRRYNWGHSAGPFLCHWDFHCHPIFHAWSCLFFIFWGLIPHFWMLVLNVLCWLLDSLVSCHKGWHSLPAQSLWPVLGTLDLWFSMVAFEFFTNKHQNIYTKPMFSLLISVSGDHTLVANNWSYISCVLYGRIS